MGPFLIFKCAENARIIRGKYALRWRVFSAHSPRILRVFSAHSPRARKMRGKYAENAREYAWFPPGQYMKQKRCTDDDNDKTEDVCCDDDYPPVWGTIRKYLSSLQFVWDHDCGDCDRIYVVIVDDGGWSPFPLPGPLLK